MSFTRILVALLLRGAHWISMGRMMFLGWEPQLGLGCTVHPPPVMTLGCTSVDPGAQAQSAEWGWAGQRRGCVGQTRALTPPEWAVQARRTTWQTCNFPRHPP